MFRMLHGRIAGNEPFTLVKFVEGCCNNIAGVVLFPWCVFFNNDPGFACQSPFATDSCNIGKIRFLFGGIVA